MKKKIIAVDAFCGAGGYSHSLWEACIELGYDLDLTAINHWRRAIETHTANLPFAKHILQDFEAVRPRDAVPGGHLDIFWASPSCVYHSRARGGKPIHDQKRISPWHVIPWLDELDITGLGFENVPEFVKWGPTIKRKVTRTITFLLGLLKKLPFAEWALKMQNRFGGYKSEWQRIYRELRTARSGSDRIKRQVEITVDLPDPARRGEIFDAWRAAIERHGYKTEWRILNSADYGGYTTRSRFFMIARKRGRKIVFPMPTHSKTPKANFLGKTEKYKAAADIIDWTDLGKSIFGREKPLAENTWRRVFAGLERCSGITFLGVDGDTRPRSPDEIMTMIVKGDAGTVGKPFLISLRGTSAEAVAHSNSEITDPAPGITANGNHLAVATPIILSIRGGDDPYTRATPADAPVGAITSSPAMAVVTPKMEAFTIGIGGQQGHARPRGLDKPIVSPLTDNHTALVQPVLESFTLGQQSDATAREVSEPVQSPATKGAIRVVNSFLLPVHHGADTRTHEVQDLLPTITSVDGMALASSYIIEMDHSQRHGQPFKSAQEPLTTITSADARQLATAFLSTYHGDQPGHERVQPVTEPLPVQDTANRHALVSPYLVEYFGMSEASPVSDPLPSPVSRDHYALVSPIIVQTTDGRLWLFDILLRMLKPKELANAMGFPLDYDFKGTREDVVKQIGNAVEGRVAKALTLSMLMN